MSEFHKKELALTYYRMCAYLLYVVDSKNFNVNSKDEIIFLKDRLDYERDFSKFLVIFIECNMAENDNVHIWNELYFYCHSNGIPTISLIYNNSSSVLLEKLATFIYLKGGTLKTSKKSIRESSKQQNVLENQLEWCSPLQFTDIKRKLSHI